MELNIIKLGELPGPAMRQTDFTAGLAPLRKRGAVGKWHSILAGSGSMGSARAEVQYRKGQLKAALYDEGTLGYEFVTRTVDGAPTLLARYNTPDL